MLSLKACQKFSTQNYNLKHYEMYGFQKQLISMLLIVKSWELLLE